MKPILFVHVPKVGGTSLVTWLASVVGAEHVFQDYRDRLFDPASEINRDPAAYLAHNSRGALPPGVAAITGHFWAKKYETLADVFRMTFLRDPVDRAISHYFFLRERQGSGNLLRRRIFEDNLSVAAFAALPEIAGYYRHHFFRDVDLETFDFVGDYARYDEELTRLETLLGVRGTRTRDNVNRSPTYAEERARALEPGPTRDAMRDALADETAFYLKHAGR